MLLHSVDITHLIIFSQSHMKKFQCKEILSVFVNALIGATFQGLCSLMCAVLNQV